LSESQLVLVGAHRSVGGQYLLLVDERIQFLSFRIRACLAASVLRPDGLPAPLLDFLNTLIRKSAHVTQFAVLTALLYRAASGAGPLLWRPGLARWCGFWAALYALTDEFHQIFVPGRGASLLDCVFDFLGVLTAMFLLYLHLRRRRETASFRETVLERHRAAQRSVPVFHTPHD